MIDTVRLAECIERSGLSFSELARRVGVQQPTISRLVKGEQRGSARLHLIARELGTTPAYLTGEIDDPNEGAPPPAALPPIQLVTMQVALPPERALARMFVGLLRMVPEDASEDETALLLARRLPIGLSQLRDLLPAGAVPRGVEAVPPTPEPARQS